MFETIVQSTHLDMFGHVNNARYFEYFEWARWAWGSAQGVDFLALIQQGLGPAVVRMEANFLKELHLSDGIKVLTRPFALGNTSFDLVQEMMNEEEAMVATLKVKIVFMDMKKRSAAPIPEPVRAILERLM